MSNKKYEVCRNCKHGGINGGCDSDKFIYDDMGEAPEDGLVYWDHEGYNAGFSTGPLFGCIHFEDEEEHEAFEANYAEIKEVKK